jgi:hypothetical protein
MPQFHETGYGKRFFEGQLPEFLRQLKALNTNLDRFVKIGKLLAEWGPDIHCISESFAIHGEALAVLSDIDTSDNRVKLIKIKLDEIFEAIEDIGKEAGYKRKDETQTG